MGTDLLPGLNFDLHLPWLDLEVSAHGLRCVWNGQEIEFAWGFEVTGVIQPDPIPEYSRLWGPGTRLILPASWPVGLEGQVSLNLFSGWRGIVILGEVFPPERGRELDRLPLLTIRFSAEEASRWRWLLNSGHQGFSGSVSYDQRLSELPFSQDVTVLSRPGAALGLGNLTFRRTNLLFERQVVGSEYGLDIVLAYGQMELSSRLELEALLVLPERDPLAALEEYADCVAAVVKPRFNPARPGLYNQWYANWTPTSDHGTARLALEGAQLLRSSPLYRYGICTIGSGVWHNRAAFGEEEAWPGHFPAGIEGLCEQVRDAGLEFMHGGFWGKASQCATIFRQHPDWMAKDESGSPAQVAAESWGACRSPYSIPDITLPVVQDWVRSQWKHIDRSSTGFYWLDFYGTGTGINLDIERPAPLRFHNRQLSFPFETDRLLTGIIRETVGEEAVIGVYTSPTFNLLGLIDRARVALDCGAIDPPGASEVGSSNLLAVSEPGRRWKHLQAVARNLAAAYFCHNRFWVNDPDPAMVGLVDRPETLEEARLRVALAANSGGFITIGEAIDRIPPGRIALLKAILPPHGQAARPLDLLEVDIPGIYDLLVQTRWDCWHVLTLVNWEDQEKLAAISLPRLGLGGKQLVFEFWEQAFLGSIDWRLEATLPPRCCRIFCLRPTRSHPWLLSTDLHLTQGGVEVEQVAWDPGRQILQGCVYRPDGEGSLVIHVPGGYAPAGAKVGSRLVQFAQPEGEILGLPVQFTGKEVFWEVHFTQVTDG